MPVLFKFHLYAIDSPEPLWENAKEQRTAQKTLRSGEEQPPKKWEDEYGFHQIRSAKDSWRCTLG